MRYFVILFLLACLVSACGQQPARRTITNNAGANHVPVSGTRLSLAPPAGFTLSTNFTGFQQDETGSSIMVMEIPGDFNTMADAFSPAGMLRQGLQMKRKESLVINGQGAFLIDAEQTAYGIVFTKYILGLDTDESVVMINGVHPRELQEEMGEAVRASVLSVVYDPAQSADPASALNFTIDADSSKLQLANVISNSMVFTVDGLTPTQSKDKSALMVTSSLSEVLVANRVEFAKLRLMQMPTISDVSIESRDDVHINGIDGVEIVAYGNDDNTGGSKMIFQTMLFDSNLYFLIVGTALDDFETNLTMFREIASTFQLK